MKKNLFRSLAFIAAASMLMASCGDKSPAESSKPTSSTGSASSSGPSTGGTVDAEHPFWVSQEPIELTAHIHWGTYVLDDEKWIVTQEAAKMTNVSLKGTASPMQTDSTEAFNLMISGQTIPDLVGGDRNLINQYGMEGAFMPLNDLIEEYAPNFKKILDENPDVRGAITAADGNIYQIPFMYESLVSEAWMIRQDWLDKLGLEAPTTVDEMYDVLTAFVNEDPNGNGQTDEVGYFTRLGTGGGTNVLKGVLSLFGVQDAWHIGKDGKVAIGLYTEGYKEAIKNVSKWYAEGLIDKEIFTRGSSARDMLFPENNGGVIHDWIPSCTGFNNKLQDTVPGFKLVGILPPVDSNGDQWILESRDKITGNGWAMSATNKYPEETMKYMDFWWTEEGRRLSTYGIEGVTYNMVDGKPVYVDEILNGTTAINDYMRKIGGQIDIMAYLHDASYESFMMDEEGAKATQLYKDSGLIQSLYPKLPALSFTTEELDTINSKYPPCRTYMMEQLQKWTFDGSTIDAEFDNYMATLKSMGMDEIVGIYQAAYDRLMSAE